MSIFRSTPNHISIKYRCPHYYFVECRHVYLNPYRRSKVLASSSIESGVFGSRADVYPGCLRGMINDPAGTFDLAACSIALRKKGDDRDIMAWQQKWRIFASLSSRPSLLWMLQQHNSTKHFVDGRSFCNLVYKSIPTLKQDWARGSKRSSEESATLSLQWATLKKEGRKKGGRHWVT